MSADLFTVADYCQLAMWGIADIPAPRQQRSRWPAERLLEAARDGALFGPNLADPDSPDDLPIRLDGRELSEPEARLLADLLDADRLVWLGTRITLTARGRALLDQWTRYQRIPHLGGGQA